MAFRCMISRAPSASLSQLRNMVTDGRCSRHPQHGFMKAACWPIVRQRRGMLISRAAKAQAGEPDDLLSQIKQKNAQNPLVVYAKTYCPFCQQVKGLFAHLKVDPKVIDLDTIHEGPDIQDALVDLSGIHTVPQVFIGGHFVGGCTDTMALHDSGKLQELLNDAGVAVAQ